jgi:hypothetical protein
VLHRNALPGFARAICRLRGPQLRLPVRTSASVAHNVTPAVLPRSTACCGNSGPHSAAVKHYPLDACCKVDPHSAAAKYCTLLHMQLAAQVNTFLLGGYETTANSLSFLVYYLSTHPEAQKRLQQEVDDVLEGRAPTMDDIPKVCGRGCDRPCTLGLGGFGCKLVDLDFAQLPLTDLD